MLNTDKLRTVRKCLVNSRWSIDDILKDSDNEEKVNKYLDFIIMSSEIVIGNIYDIKNTIKTPQNTANESGTLKITLRTTSENWLNIHIDSLLPGNRAIASAKNFEKQLKSALSKYAENNKFPKYDKAFMVIIEHCCHNTCKSFDHDNKNLRVVPNCLKGMVFPDDNQFHLSMAIATAYDEAETYLDIYILPQEMISIFAKSYLDSL